MGSKFHFESEYSVDGAGLLGAVYGVFRDDQRVGWLVVDSLDVTEKQDVHHMKNYIGEVIGIATSNPRLELGIQATFHPNIEFDDSILRPKQHLPDHRQALPAPPIKTLYENNTGTKSLRESNSEPGPGERGEETENDE